MAKIYVIASGKGGVGKTTSAINLGAALNKLGKDVLIVDTNLSTPNISLYLGAPSIPISLNHILNGKAELDDAIYEHESGMKIIPSSISLSELGDLDKGMLDSIARKLKKKANYIIFDSAAGLGGEALAAISASDEVILVTNPDILSATNALKTARIARTLGKKVKGAIVTRVLQEKDEMSIENLKGMLETNILGIVPEDSSVKEALASKSPVIYSHPKSHATLAYRLIAAKLLGKKYVDEFEKSQKFYYRFLRAFGLY